MRFCQGLHQRHIVLGIIHHIVAGNGHHIDLTVAAFSCKDHKSLKDVDDEGAVVAHEHHNGGAAFKGVIGGHCGAGEGVRQCKTWSFKTEGDVCGWGAGHSAGCCAPKQAP